MLKSSVFLGLFLAHILSPLQLKPELTDLASYLDVDIAVLCVCLEDWDYSQATTPTQHICRFKTGESQDNESVRLEHEKDPIQVW